MQKNKKNHILITLLLLIHVISWILFMPIGQIQMMLFGKRILSFVHYGIIEIILVTLLLAQTGWKLKINKLGKENIIYCVVFMIAFIVNVVKTDSITPFIIMFYLMFWIFPVCLIWIIEQFDYNIDKFLKFMMLIIILHACLIFYQHYTNNAFWPYLTYNDGEVAFELDSYYSTNKHATRCSGMTRTSLDAGILLMFGIVLVIRMSDFKKGIKICLLILFSIAICFTGTRSIYIMMVYILSMILLMKFKSIEKKKINIMILFTIVLVFIYFFIILCITNIKTTGNLLTDTTSIGIRLKKWEEVIESFKTIPILDLLFGCMQWQNAGNCIIIDNMYLELIYCSGILSFICYVRYIIMISKKQVEKNKYVSLISASFTLCYLIYGVLNSTSNFYFSLIILLLLLEKNNLIEANNKDIVK